MQGQLMLILENFGVPTAREGDSGPTAVHGAEKNIYGYARLAEGEKEAVEQCEEVYHNLTCRYEKVN